MLEVFSAVLGFPHYYLGQCKPRKPESMQAYQRLQEIRAQKEALYEKYFQFVIDEDGEGEEAREAYKALSAYRDNTKSEIETLKDELYKEGAWYIAYDLYFQVSKNLEIGTRIEIYDNRLITYRFAGTVTSENYHEVGYDAYWREEARYREFMHSFEDAIVFLRAEPIMAESGSFEEKPLAPRTYADVQNEIASNLANLPRFTARVKIASDTQTVEHTVKTLSPEQGLGRTALEQRKATIKAQNLLHDYYRLRKDVEAEITTRQQRFSGSSSTQPQPTSQGYARQVPVQGKCPNCGFSKNASGARFCMQCGTQLK